MIALSVV